MALEDTLEELAERRLAFKAYRTTVEDELRKLRAERLAAEQASIEYIIVKAMAEGATLGQVKRAYGTKDHRTISGIVEARASEITAVRDAAKAVKAEKKDWFTFDGDTVQVKVNGHPASFAWAEVDGEIMFTTDEPLWDEAFTTRNEAVALLDGKTESSSDEASILAEEIRKRG